MSTDNGFAVGFSKAVEAILAVVQTGAAMGDVYIYPHEVRENLRIAGMRLDRKLADLTPFPTYQAPEFPEGYEPDFEQPEYQPEDEGDEPAVPAEEEMIHAR